MIFSLIQHELENQHFQVVDKDLNRPRDGFSVIAEKQAQRFAAVYFDSVDISSLKISSKLSPKILIEAQNKILSWQYHNRRFETCWRVIQSQASVLRSNIDFESELEILNIGATVTLIQGERHRLVGLGDYAFQDEIWQYTDVDNPSDEIDIVPLQDDFGR